ncbi:MAG: potassium channel family protein [Flavobacteriaceae bacterium]
MVKVILVGVLVIIVNLFFQAFGNILWLRKIVASFVDKSKKLTNRRILYLLTTSFIFLTILHALHALVWAVCYYSLPKAANDFSSFSDAIYFSVVTFTTLGYGDITLSSGWRLLSGIEAINGIMLIGWSTAMMYSLIQRIYKNLND